MKVERKITKTEIALLGLTGLFLCSLLVISARDRAAVTAAGTELAVDVPQESFLPDLTPLDLNTATAEELEGLPGIGAELAGRILEYREETGGFHSVEELLEISGIGTKKLEALRDRVAVNGGNE